MFWNGNCLGIFCFNLALPPTSCIFRPFVLGIILRVAELERLQYFLSTFFPVFILGRGQILYKLAKYLGTSGSLHFSHHQFCGNGGEKRKVLNWLKRAESGTGLKSRGRD